MTARTVSFATLGCRLNQVDTQQLQTVLESRGFRTVPFGEPADVVVVNTCAVTARAELSDRQAIRRAARVNPRARLVVTGCWAQTRPDDVARFGEVDLIVGNTDKHRLAELLEGRVAERVHVGDVARARTLDVAPLARVHGRSRAFLKIQDGCQHRCAFCIVPFARGTSRSLEPKVVLDQARLLVGAGHPEIVLTGVDTGHYGADLAPRTTLAALLRQLEDVPGLRWVRLSSVLPAYFTPELIDVVTDSPVVAPHFHIPLQSGSDRILRAMRRPYNVAMYRGVVERLAAAIPLLGLGADLITGFPGESDADFRETVRLSRRCPSPISTCSRTRPGRGPRPRVSPRRRTRGRLPVGRACSVSSPGRKISSSAAGWSGTSRRRWCSRRGTARPEGSPASRATTSRCGSTDPARCRAASLAFG